MKSGRSIQDVSREILRQQEAKADYLVATDRLHMDTYGDSPVIRVLDREGIDQIEPLEIQQTAHQQIGTYLDIPSKYYDRMLQRDPALLSYNVNRWFQKEPEQKLLRLVPERAGAEAAAHNGRQSQSVSQQPLSPHRQSGHRPRCSSYHRGNGGRTL